MGRFLSIAGAFFFLFSTVQPQAQSLSDQRQVDATFDAVRIVALSEDGATMVGYDPTILEYHPFLWSKADNTRFLDDSFWPKKICNHGRTVIGKDREGRHPLIWTESDGLHPLFAVKKGDFVDIEDVSDTCETVSGQWYQAAKKSTAAFVWTREKGVEILASIPGTSAAQGVSTLRLSASGTTLAGRLYLPKKKSSDMFIWTKENGLRFLKKTSTLYPTALSENGRFLVGGVYDGDDSPLSFFRWSTDSGVEILPLPFPQTSAQQTDIFAKAWLSASFVSNDGKTVMGAITRPGPNYKRIKGAPLRGTAFVWSESEGLHLLSPLEGDMNSRFRAISTNGQRAIVDGYTLGTYRENDISLLLWTPAGKMHPLSEILPPDAKDLPVFVSMSADGRVLALADSSYGQLKKSRLLLVRLPEILP